MMYKHVGPLTVKETNWKRPERHWEARTQVAHVNFMSPFGATGWGATRAEALEALRARLLKSYGVVIEEEQ